MQRITMIVVCAAGGIAAAQCPPAFTQIQDAAGLIAAHAPPTTSSMAWAMSGGMAAGDFNRDGWQDLFVLASGGGPDHLFINNRDGTFTDQAAAWGVDAVHIGIGAAVADYDGDGWLDIFVTSFGDPALPAPGAHRLYHNTGHSSFTEVAQAAGVATTSPTVADGFGAAFGDYDRDGDLDLAVAGWADQSGGNRLLRNNGDGSFTDVTTSVILADLTDVNGFSPRFADMDGDGYPELLWTADYRTGRYLVNNAGVSFTNETTSAGIGLESNGMGTTVIDLNDDGLLDWVVTSIDYSLKADPRPPLDGNMVYLNQGNHTYLEASDVLEVSAGWWGWGIDAVDINNDGTADLAETNGFHYDPWLDRPACLWMGGTTPMVESAANSSFVHTGNGRGLIRFDMDNDGDQDLAIVTNHGSLTVFRNDLDPACSHWLRVTLDAACAPGITPDGVGAIVAVTAGGRTQTHIVQAGPTYLSQSELPVHFGLGGATTIDELRITWTDGSTTTLSGLPADRSITVRAQPDRLACGRCPADLTGSADPNDPAFGVPDGTTDASDFFFYLDAFASGDLRADLTGSSNPADPLYDLADGTLDAADFFRYLDLFALGCP